MTMIRARWLMGLSLAATALAASLLTSGCNVMGGIGAMAQDLEYQKLLEVPAKYEGLADHTVAVLVDADLTTRYEHQTLVADVSRGVSMLIARHVPTAKVLPVAKVISWQYHTPQWSTIPYGEMASQLGVDRIVYVDLYEYRLNPPGNRFEWDAAASANVHVIESTSPDPDTPAESFDVTTKYPLKSGTVSVENTSQQMIETILLSQFVSRVAWQFYLHTEPKHPDKYRAEPS